MAKEIIYGEEARKALMNGINQLADTVKLHLVQRLQCCFGQKFGAPLVTNDGVTIAKEVELDDPFEKHGRSACQRSFHQNKRCCGRRYHNSYFVGTSFNP